MLKSFRMNPLVFSLFCIFMVMLAYFFGIPFLDEVELKTVDLRFQTRGTISPRPEVVLAVIDEKSIAREGKWVWPRSKIADLIDKLSQAGATVVAFDIGFLEPDDKRMVQVFDKIKQKLSSLKLKNQALEHYLDTLTQQSDNDRRLADAIKNSKAKVVLGYFFQMSAKDAGHIDADELSAHEKNVKGSTYKFVRFESKRAQDTPLIEAAAPQSNIKKISEATPYAGFFNMEPDTDGVVRWIPGVFRFKDMLYAPLSLNTISAYVDRPLSASVAEFGVERLQVGDLTIPADELGRIFVNYRGKGNTFPHISVTDILKGQVPPEMLKDKIVMVGATAIGIFDLRVTPFSTVFPGLEIHANVVDSILSHDFIRKPGWAALFDVLAIILSGLFLGFVLPRTGAIFGAVAAAVLLIGHVVLCQTLFSTGGLILNMVYPVSVTVMIYLGITLHKYIKESSQKRFIKEAFSTYLAPSVVKQIIDSPGNLVLGGEERDITAFFSDLQGFTSISEKLSAPELVELLNEFLTEMTDIILSYEGTLDKFEGDAIIAFFGAPNHLENHAETACLACVEMQKRLAGMRTKWKSENRPELLMRIGLCSGPAVVGNMGSKNRMDYTMMGDTVNTAARLEGVNKQYGIYTLISEATCRAAGNRILTREVDSLHVMGKTEPVAVYQLLGYPEDYDDRMMETIGLYTRGLKAYRKQDWDRAIEFFQGALGLVPDDGPSRTMIARARQFKTDPPGRVGTAPMS